MENIEVKSSPFYNEIVNSKRPYRVKVISTASPHIFWLDPFLDMPTVSAESYILLQAGLVNIFPIEAKLADPTLQMEWSSSTEWVSSAVVKLRQFIDEATEIYFFPKCRMNDEFTYVNNSVCVFGDLIIIRNSRLESVSNLLRDLGLAYSCPARFNRYIETRSCFLEIDERFLNVHLSDAIEYAENRIKKCKSSDMNQKTENSRAVTRVKREIEDNQKTLHYFVERNITDKANVDKIFRQMEQVYQNCLQVYDKQWYGKSVRQPNEYRKRKPKNTVQHEEDDNSSDSTVVKEMSKPTPSHCFFPAGMLFDTKTDQFIKKFTQNTNSSGGTANSTSEHQFNSMDYRGTHKPHENQVAGHTDAFRYKENTAKQKVAYKECPMLIENGIDFNLYPKKHNSSNKYDNPNSESNYSSMREDYKAAYVRAQPNAGEMIKKPAEKMRFERKNDNQQVHLRNGRENTRKNDEQREAFKDVTKRAETDWNKSYNDRKKTFSDRGIYDTVTKNTFHAKKNDKQASRPFVLEPDDQTIGMKQLMDSKEFTWLDGKTLTEVENDGKTNRADSVLTSLECSLNADINNKRKRTSLFAEIPVRGETSTDSIQNRPHLIPVRSHSRAPSECGGIVTNSNEGGSKHRDSLSPNIDSFFKISKMNPRLRKQSDESMSTCRDLERSFVASNNVNVDSSDCEDKKGFSFSSDRDSNVFTGLVNRNYREDSNNINEHTDTLLKDCRPRFVRKSSFETKMGNKTVDVYHSNDESTVSGSETSNISSRCKKLMELSNIQSKLRNIHVTEECKSKNIDVRHSNDESTVSGSETSNISSRCKKLMELSNIQSKLRNIHETEECKSKNVDLSCTSKSSCTAQSGYDSVSDATSGITSSTYMDISRLNLSNSSQSVPSNSSSNSSAMDSSSGSQVPNRMLIDRHNTVINKEVSLQPDTDQISQLKWSSLKNYSIMVTDVSDMSRTKDGVESIASDISKAELNTDHLGPSSQGLSYTESVSIDSSNSSQVSKDSTSYFGSRTRILRDLSVMTTTGTNSNKSCESDTSVGSVVPNLKTVPIRQNILSNFQATTTLKSFSPNADQKLDCYAEKLDEVDCTNGKKEESKEIKYASTSRFEKISTFIQKQNALSKECLQNSDSHLSAKSLQCIEVLKKRNTADVKAISSETDELKVRSETNEAICHDVLEDFAKIQDTNIVEKEVMSKPIESSAKSRVQILGMLYQKEKPQSREFLRNVELEKMALVSRESKGDFHFKEDTIGAGKSFEMESTNSKLDEPIKTVVDDVRMVHDTIVDEKTKELEPVENSPLGFHETKSRFSEEVNPRMQATVRNRESAEKSTRKARSKVDEQDKLVKSDADNVQEVCVIEEFKPKGNAAMRIRKIVSMSTREEKPQMQEPFQNSERNDSSSLKSETNKPILAVNERAENETKNVGNSVKLETHEMARSCTDTGVVKKAHETISVIERKEPIYPLINVTKADSVENESGVIKGTLIPKDDVLFCETELTDELSIEEMRNMIIDKCSKELNVVPGGNKQNDAVEGTKNDVIGDTKILDTGEDDPDLITDYHQVKSSSPISSLSSGNSWKSMSIGLLGSHLRKSSITSDILLHSLSPEQSNSLNVSVVSQPGISKIDLSKDNSSDVSFNSKPETSKQISNQIDETRYDSDTNSFVNIEADGTESSNRDKSNRGDHENEPFQRIIMEYFDDIHPSNSLIEGILTPRVIVHSKNGQVCSPWRELSNVTFPQVIVNNLKNMGVVAPGKIQSTVWPAIVRGGSAFIVGPANSGRGLSILAPVLSHISSTMSMIKDETVALGPQLLIVCPNTGAASKTFYICSNLLRGCLTSNGKHFKVVKIDDCNDSENAWKFVDHSDIMISTPQCLSQYIHYEISILKMSRLTFLYLEDLDLLNETQSKETINVIDWCQKKVKEEENRELNVYATTKTWCNVFKRIATESPDPTLFIGALQECIFYSGMELQVRFLKSEEKLIRLRKLMKDYGTGVRKTIIVCQNDNEIKNVTKELESDEHVVLSANTSMTLDILNEIRLSWRKCKNVIGNLIMVCSDTNLQFLDVVNANWLIHYSLPKTYTKFNLRFSTMAASYPNLYLENQSKTQLRVDVFIDEKNILQLPKIVHFVERYGIDTPPAVKELMIKISSYKDLQKARLYVPLCNNLLSYGECHDLTNCIERHSLVPADRLKDWIPKTGFVKCKVLIPLHATLFSARLLEHISFEGVTTKIQQKNILIFMEMATYFAVEGNRRSHSKYQLGDVCAIKFGNVYERCQIIRIMPTSNHNEPEEVLVNLLEEQQYIIMMGRDLLHLPDRLKNLTSATVKIRVVGLAPSESNVLWSVFCLQNVRQLFSNKEYMVRGRIVLGIDNTLFLDNVHLCKHLETLKVDTVKIIYKNHLVSNNFAVENPSHLNQLYNLCSRFDFELPQYEISKKSSKKQNLPVPNWAFLSPNKYTEVYFVSANSLGQLFVRVFACQRTLNELEDDLQKYVEGLKNKFIEIEPDLNDEAINDGYYCVAKYVEDGLYYRARIEQVTNDREMGMLYKCFFVDHGDVSVVKHDEIFPINGEFITRMPFQAIESRLLGLEPIGKKWTDIETDTLYDYCFIGNTVDLKILVCKYYTKEKAEYTKGNKYGIVLADPEMKESLNEIFVKVELANAVGSEMELIVKDNDALVQVLNEMNAVNVEEDESDSEDESQLNPKIPDYILNYRKDSSAPQSVSSQKENTAVSVAVSESKDEMEKEREGLIAWPEEEEEDDDDVWDVQFDKDDYVALMNRDDLSRLIKNSEPVTRKSSILDQGDFVVVSNEDHLRGIIETNAGPKYVKPLHNTPKVLWHQNDSSVTVKIQLPNVTLYECTITNNHLLFETCVDGCYYSINSYLYGGVKTAECYHCAKGTYIFIRLYKLNNILWDSLLGSEVKDKRIVYDPDFIYIEANDSSDDEENLKDGIKKRDKKIVIEDSDGDEGGDEDDETLNSNYIESDPINMQILDQLHRMEDCNED